MSGPSDNAAALLQAQFDELRDCRACALHAGRTQVVFGVGNPYAELMFVGEGPGFNEDKQGEPFVGQAGQLLTELLAQIELTRADVYIANVVKCRPPGNRDPLPDEIEACSPHLLEQIRVIRPKVICTLGRFATRLLGRTEAPMGSVRGRAKQVELAGVSLLVFPVFHPAAALYTPSNRVTLEDDFRKLKLLLSRGGTLPQPDGDSRGRGEQEPQRGPAVQPAAAQPAQRTPPPDSAPERPEQLPLW